MKHRKSLPISETKQKLDAISPTFCGAKWSQVLFQFHLGTLHNCCLTTAQPIDLKQLFESENLVKQRESFLEGEREPECQACWLAEDNGLVSDRFYKSSEPSAQPLYEAGKKPSVRGVVPTYIEISLTNRCQFKCAYCSPENSSALFNEMKIHGPYHLEEEYNSIESLENSPTYFQEKDDNPYVDSFIKWYPSIAGQVQVLRFTGGEPLLSNRVFEVLELLKENPSPELELIFNSNLGIPEKVLDKFIEDLKKLPANCYGNLCFITSVDGWDEGARIARWGLNFELFERNFLKIRKEFPEAKIRFTCTVNVLAVTGLKRLLSKIYDWKQTQSYTDQILITAYPIHYPSFLSLKWTHDFFRDEIQEAQSFLNSLFVGDELENGFISVEKDMFEKATTVTSLLPLEGTSLVDFTLFMLQHQQRKKWNKEDLPPKVLSLLNQGMAYIQNQINSESFPARTALKCLPYFQGPQDEIRKNLKQSLQSGKYNPWAILHTLLQFIDHLEPAWIDWWFEIDVPEGGIKLAEHPRFHDYQNFQHLVVKVAPTGRVEFWEALGSQTVLPLLQKRTLDRIFMFLPNPVQDIHRIFMKRLQVVRPEYQHPGLRNN